MNTNPTAVPTSSPQDGLFGGRDTDNTLKSPQKSTETAGIHIP